MSSTAKKAGRISIAVFGSRILGLVRESLFAHFFGAGMASDAFRAAFKIPNLLRDLFAEGALSTAFVTTFTQTSEKKGDASAWRLANLIFTLQVAVLFVLVVLGIFCAPSIVRMVASGLDAETSGLAASLARIMFPYILLVSVAAVLMGMLNARGRFGIPAMAPMFFNVGSIVFGLLIGWLIDPQMGRSAIYGMACGVVIGGCLQVCMQLPIAFKAGFRFRPAWDLKDEGLRHVLKLMVPSVIGASAVQVNVVINTQFASHLGPGAISWLEYAFRLMMFPIGLLGVAIATVTLPLVSKNVAANNLTLFCSNLAHSLRLVFSLTIPAAVGLMVLAEPIIKLVLERGRFSPNDTAQTALALKAYVVGLAGYAAIKVVVPGFYALNLAKIPLRISLLGIGLNLGFCFLFTQIFSLGHAGLALSTSMIAILNFTQLALSMRSRLGSFEGTALLRTILKSLLASAPMGATVLFWLAFVRSLPDFCGREIVGVLSSIVLGGTVFAACAMLLKIGELDEIIKTVWKKFSKKQDVS